MFVANVKNCHWIIIKYETKLEKIFVIDTLQFKLKDIKNDIQVYLEFIEEIAEKKLKIESENIGKQKLDNSCGLLILNYIRKNVEGTFEKEEEPDEKYLRYRITKELLLQKLLKEESN